MSSLLGSSDSLDLPKAAKMCFRSAYYCKVRRSWLDRALPRKTQNIEKRSSNVLGIGASSACKAHSPLPHSGSRLSFTVDKFLYTCLITIQVFSLWVLFLSLQRWRLQYCWSTEHIWFSRLLKEHLRSFQKSCRKPSMLLSTEQVTLVSYFTKHVHVGDQIFY